MSYFNRILLLVATAYGVISTAGDPSPWAHLLQRQAPGSPAYLCHEDCGQAVHESKSTDDICGDDVFLTSYNSCLQCAGPNNTDIWKYYGGTLSGVAAGCGLPTMPDDAEATSPATPTTGTGAVPGTSPSTVSIPATTHISDLTAAPSGASATSEATTTRGTTTTLSAVIQTPNPANMVYSNPGQLYGAAALGGLIYVVFY